MATKRKLHEEEVLQRLTQFACAALSCVPWADTNGKFYGDRYRAGMAFRIAEAMYEEYVKMEVKVGLLK